MKDLSRFKRFLKEHQYAIILAGLSTGLILVIVVSEYYVYRAGCKDGLQAGARTGFHATIDWADKTFPEIHLGELWKNWALANPDQLV